MLFRLLILSIFLFPVSMQGQVTKLNIKKSDASKDDKIDSHIFMVCNTGDGGVVVIRSLESSILTVEIIDRHEFKIEYYDAEMQLVNERYFDWNKTLIKNMMVDGRRLHVVVFDKDKSDNVYSVLTADLDEFEFEKKEFFRINKKNMANSLYRTEYGYTNAFGKNDSDPTGLFFKSRNGKYLCAAFDIKESKKSAFRFMVFDLNQEIIFDEKVVLPYKDIHYSLSNTEISNDGQTVYFAGSVFEKNIYGANLKTFKKKTYQISKLTADNLIHREISQKDGFIPSKHLALIDDKLYMAGFYSDNDANKSTGIFYLKLNAEDLAVEKRKYSPFGKQYHIDMHGKKTGTRKYKKAKEYQSYHMRSAYLTNEGALYFTAESIGSLVVVNGSVSLSDFITGKIDTEGNLEWTRLVDKRQHSGELESIGTINPYNYYSVASIYDDGHIYLFVNARKNLKTYADGRVRIETKLNKMNLYHFDFGPDGDFDYKILIPKSRSKFDYRVFTSHFNDRDNSLLMEAGDGKNKRLIRISPE